MKDLSIPSHIAIIMDGNGRWAEKRGKSRSAGHSEGAEAFRRIVEYCAEIGVKYLTVYAFSTENWRRSKSEIDAIMLLLKNYIKKYTNSLKENNIGLHFFGSKNKLPNDLVRMIDNAERVSAGTTGLQVGVCFNYGGRDDIVYAARQAARDILDGKMSEEELTEDYISKHLYTCAFPDPDIVIRPSGELRISNFLIWQIAYSEFYFDDVLWPDFLPEHLDKAIEDFNNRSRRFGGN